MQGREQDVVAARWQTRGPLPLLPLRFYCRRCCYLLCVLISAFLEVDELEEQRGGACTWRARHGGGAGG